MKTSDHSHSFIFLFWSLSFTVLVTWWCCPKMKAKSDFTVKNNPWRNLSKHTLRFPKSRANLGFMKFVQFLLYLNSFFHFYFFLQKIEFDIWSSSMFLLTKAVFKMIFFFYLNQHTFRWINHSECSLIEYFRTNTSFIIIENNLIKDLLWKLYNPTSEVSN